MGNAKLIATTRLLFVSSHDRRNILLSDYESYSTYVYARKAAAINEA